jgi:hypothetical protein
MGSASTNALKYQHDYQRQRVKAVQLYGKNITNTQEQFLS